MSDSAEKDAASAEAVEVVRGYVTYNDGSQSPVERWVRASDDRWVSLDSERTTRRDLTWVMDEAPCVCGWTEPRGPRCPDCHGLTDFGQRDPDWLAKTISRAKQRLDSLPLHARPVVSKPSVFPPDGRQS